MKTKYSVVRSTLLLCTTVLTVGCSSGGGSGGSDNPVNGTVSTATTVVSGTTGSGTSGGTTSNGIFQSQKSTTTESGDTSAILRVDKNGDGILDDNDFVYTVPVLTDGSFSFNDVVVDETKPTKAQLTVAKVGFAPVVKTVTLTKDTPLSVFADVSTKPLLTEVVNLPATASDRANTFLKFGITSDENGLSSFSRLLSLSELKAESDVGLGEGTLTEATIPASAFDLSVKSVTANMQAFDSTNADDIAHFPGSFSGHGKSSLTPDTADNEQENTLESAAFDLISLTDQDGNPVELQMAAQSKLTAQGAASCSGMYWVRRVNSSQAAIIEEWGDDDNDSSNGFQVPIWSNDNATGSWAYVGLGLWDKGESQFSACVDKKWQGYLNCDSQINVGNAPKELCVYAEDQFGDSVDGLTFKAQKGNTYASAYIYNGKAVIDLAGGTPADWNVSYRGAMTSWSEVGVDSALYVTSTTPGCDFDLNVTVDNPYSAQVYVFARDDKNATVDNAYVTLKSNTYNDYYNKAAYTNAKGYTIFKVKPNVVYTAGYIAGTSLVNVNGSVVAPETADSGKYASVDVQDAAVAPQAYLNMKTRVTDNTETLDFSISATDRNKDIMNLVSLSVGATKLTQGIDYNITYNSSYAGNLYIRGILDLNTSTLQAVSQSSLSAGTYVFHANVSDGKFTAVASRTLNVATNSAPTINGLYLMSDNSYRYYYENSAIPAGDYHINYYVYDIDGNNVNKDMTIDNTAYTPGDIIHLSVGDHNITITASDGTLTSTKESHIYVGNHAPEIKSAGATSYLIDIKRGDTFKLFAYVQDRENNPLTVVAVDDDNVTHILNKVGSYGSKYQSVDIVLSQVKAQNKYTIVASDTEDNSTAVIVTVESIKGNQPPVFTKELSDVQVNINTAQTFECEATDPEGTLVTYTWTLNDVNLTESGTILNKTFTTTGPNHIKCTATDADGKFATSNASILVVDPNASGTLTVHARYEGLVVAVHNSVDYKIIEKKLTDANGVAAFNVHGDRTTFSVTAWPGMEIHKVLLMDITRPGMVNDARNACENNNSTECVNADWCTLMTADSIPNWVWDSKTDDSIPAASAVDGNGDGTISQDELYIGALAVLDANGDNKLSYAEINSGDNNRRVDEEIFAYVPVREYYIHLDPFNDEYENEGYYNEGYACNQNNTFNSLVTLNYDSVLGATVASNSTRDIYISGSGYGSAYNTDVDSNNDINVSVYTYYAGKNGKFTYLVQEKEDNAPEYHFYLLNDKTKAEMDANITLDASKFVAADKNVSFISEDNANIDLLTSYQGIYFGNSVPRDDEDGNTLTQTKGYFTHTGFIYHITTSLYGSSSSYKTYNYYGDGSLQDNYDIKDYPFLDVVFTINSDDESWTLSGNDMSRLSVISADYYANSTSKDDNNDTLYNNLKITTNWTVAPSQMPSIALEDIVPSEAFADANATISGDNFSDNLSLDAEEFKDQTETSLLDLVAGSNSSIYSGEELWNKGVRSVESGSYYGEYSTFSTDTTKPKVHSIFTIKLNAANVFTK